ncbi:MAG: hypothetical protein M0P71_01175 [Melioribacteraceae bacterium]|nr:hypothetical protein [Melioribacteraceae bacterium]
MTINLSTIHPATRPIDAIKLRGVVITDTVPSNGQTLRYNSTTETYELVDITGEIAIVTSSNAAPSGGKNGDHHINIDTGELYKRGESSWAIIYSFGSGEASNYSVPEIIYGTDAGYDEGLSDYRCKWTSNILSVKHSLDELNPSVVVSVLNSVTGLYDSCGSIPFEIIDANNINFDFSGCSGLTFNFKIRK